MADAHSAEQWALLLCAHSCTARIPALQQAGQGWDPLCWALYAVRPP